MAKMQADLSLESNESNESVWNERNDLTNRLVQEKLQIREEHQKAWNALNADLDMLDFSPSNPVVSAELELLKEVRKRHEARLRMSRPKLSERMDEIEVRVRQIQERIQMMWYAPGMPGMFEAREEFMNMASKQPSDCNPGESFAGLGKSHP